MFAELMKEVARAPIEIGFAESMNMNLFLVNQLTQLSEIGIALIVRDSFGLGDVKSINIVCEYTADERIRDGLVDGAPPVIVIVTCWVVKKFLEIG